MDIMSAHIIEENGLFSLYFPEDHIPLNVEELNDVMASAEGTPHYAFFVGALAAIDRIEADNFEQELMITPPISSDDPSYKYMQAFINNYRPSALPQKGNVVVDSSRQLRL